MIASLAARPGYSRIIQPLLNARPAHWPRQHAARRSQPSPSPVPAQSTRVTSSGKRGDTMRRLNSVDNLFLKQEKPTQPQHTIKAVVLDPAAAHQPLTFDAVRAVVPALVEKVEPLRWQLLLPRWAAGPGGSTGPRSTSTTTSTTPRPRHPVVIASWRRRYSEIVSVGLDRGRPAWQLWYVDGLAGGRIALVMKLHHALADGLASVRLLETIFSTDPAEPLPTTGTNIGGRAAAEHRNLASVDCHQRGRGSASISPCVGALGPHGRDDPQPPQGRPARLRRGVRRARHPLQRAVHRRSSVRLRRV